MAGHSIFIRLDVGSSQYSIHINVAFGVGLLAAQPFGKPRVDVELRSLLRQTTLELSHRLAADVEGYGFFIVEEGVVVEIFGRVEGLIRGLRVGLFAVRLGGE